MSSFPQITEVVDSSTTGGQNKAFVIGEDGTKPFAYYDWADFLSDFFTTLYHTLQHTITSDASLIVLVLSLYVSLWTVRRKRSQFSNLMLIWIKMLFRLR